MIRARGLEIEYNTVVDYFQSIFHGDGTNGLILRERWIAQPGMLERLQEWFIGGEIYRHLGVTLLETMLAFGIGTLGGVIMGLWLALSPAAAAVFDPYIKAANAMPRVILAPIFFVWFGLGIWSKVALAVTLVGGVAAGLWWLDALIRRRHGGFRIY